MTLLSLIWESPYLEKMVFILRWGPGVQITKNPPQVVWGVLKPTNVCERFVTVAKVIPHAKCTTMSLHPAMGLRNTVKPVCNDHL